MVPKLSVIMSVYNGETFIRESVESILNQTFKDFEFIIVDDGSTDRTLDILNDYAKLDDRIRILRNTENKKIVYSLNKGLRNAKANVIARMDCDDISEKTRFQKQYKTLIENRDIILVGTQCYFISQKGEIISKSNFPADDYFIRLELFLKNNIIMHPSVMFRWDGNLYYREFAYPAEDYDLWLRLAHRGRFTILNEYLLTVRLNPQGTTFSKRIQQIRRVDDIHRLLIERLNYHKELSIPAERLKEPSLSHSKYFNYLFTRITPKVISHKKGTLRWLFFVILAYLAYPKMLYEKIKYYVKKILIYRNHTFIKFLEHES